MEDQTPIPTGSLPRAGQIYQNVHELYLNVGRGGSYRLARFQDVQYKTVETIAERNAIDEIFRTEGMLVWVNDELEHYMLVGGLENANWTPYLSGTYATITGSNINLAAFRTALNVNNTDNTSDINKPISTATQTALDLKQSLSAKNQANGYAGLDSGALLPLSLFPDSVLGNLKYGGTYNGTVISASDDFPELNGQNLPTSGYVGVYFIATAQFTRASVTYDVGDWIVHNGSNNYVKVDNSDAVTTVFGRLGNVVANESDYSAFYLPITNPTFTGTITGGNSVLSGSATVGTYIYGASSKRLAYTAGANLNILYSGGSGGLTINNQADNLALVNVSDAGVLTVHPLAGSGERSLVATATGAIAISAAPFITAAQTYYIGTTQNALNRASGSQTLTGVSIDGHASLDLPLTGGTLSGALIGTDISNSKVSISNSFPNITFATNGNIVTTGVQPIDFRPNDAMAMRITGGGNVGIGTSSPVNKLHIHNPTASSDVRINITDGTTTDAGGRGFNLVKASDQNAYVYNYENASLLFGTNASTRYTIDASGNNTWTGSGTFGGGLGVTGITVLSNALFGQAATLEGALTGTSATFAGSTSGGVLVSSSASAVTIPTTGFSLKTGFGNGWLYNYVSGSFAPIFYGASEHNFNAPIVGTSATFSSTGTLGSVFQGSFTNGAQSLKLGANSTATEIQSQGGVPLYLNYGGNAIILGDALTGTSATFSSSLNTIGGGVYSKNADDSYIGFDKFFTNRGRITSYNDTTATWNDISINEGGGRVLIGTDTSNGVDKLQVNGSVISTQYKLSALNTAPSSAGDTGTLGEIRIDATHIYICTATNTWKRVAIATW